MGGGYGRSLGWILTNSHLRLKGQVVSGNVQFKTTERGFVGGGGGGEEGQGWIGRLRYCTILKNYQGVGGRGVGSRGG